MSIPQHDDQDPKGPQKATNTPSRFGRHRTLFVCVALGIALLVFVVVYLVTVTPGQKRTIDKPISDVLNMADQHRLKSALITGDEIFATGTSGQQYHAYKEEGQPVTDILRRDHVSYQLTL